MVAGFCLTTPASYEYKHGDVSNPRLAAAIIKYIHIDIWRRVKKNNNLQVHAYYITVIYHHIGITVVSIVAIIIIDAGLFKCLLVLRIGILC